MSNMCLTVPNQPLDSSATESRCDTSLEVSRSRKLAWQIALFLPCPVILVASFLVPQPPVVAWQTVSGLLLIALMLAASVTDLLWHKIPNWATYTAILWALMVNTYALIGSESTVAMLGAVGLVDSLVGLVVPFFFMLVIFSMTGGGAGDVKLTAAMGAFLGLDRAIDAILFSFIFAGGFALLRAIWLQGPKNLVEIIVRTVGHWVLPLWVLPPNQDQQKFMKQPMPLGPSFALGTLLVLLNLSSDELLGSVAAMWGGT